jgi:hypothetical protein
MASSTLVEGMTTDHRVHTDQPPVTAYCTMFDSGYLARGLALIHSLREVRVDDDIWVLCLDEATKSYLSGLELRGVHLLSLSELTAMTPGLEDAKADRSRVEFFFTCTPALVCSVMQHDPNADWVIYLDADMYFFDSPRRAFDEMGDGDIGIVAHRFPDRLKHLEKYGVFNVAWVMFRATDAGRACAEWWRDRCLEWCYDHPDSGRYADQGYLDQFPTRFPTTVVLDDPGINLAPWNLGRHTVTTTPHDIRVDGVPLTFFHYHGLRKKGDWIYPNLATYKTRLTTDVRDRIYHPYISALNAIEQGALAINFGNPLPTSPPQAVSRNQRNLRSIAYRCRRRIGQIRERQAGGAFRISDVDHDSMTSRRYN